MNILGKKDKLKSSSEKYYYEPNTNRLTHSSLDDLLEAVKQNDVRLRKLNEDRLAILTASDMVVGGSGFDDLQSTVPVRQKK